MNSMMTKKEIEEAVKQLKIIEKKFPEFYKMHCMIIELGYGIEDKNFKGAITVPVMKNAI